MKEFLQSLQDAFPVLRRHPQITAWVIISLVVLAALYRARDLRKRICVPLTLKLFVQISVTSRWLYVCQDSMTVNDWKYYTSEVTGKGNVGDDIIWTLVSWPNLRAKDSFRVHGAVGMVNGIDESQAKLKARWNITHDPDSSGIGPVPARGIKSGLRRVAAKVLSVIGSI